MTTSPPVADLSWLIPIYESYGKRVEFQMLRGDWPTNFSELVGLLKKVDPNVVQAWPNNDLGTDEAGQPNAMTVRVKPFGLKLLREQPRQVHRQITVDGAKVDVRNRANFDLLNADIEQVHVVSESYLTQLRSRPNLRTCKRLKCELQRVMLLRGPELRRDLYGSICLRIGAQLPPDFWHMDSLNVCMVKSQKACA